MTDQEFAEALATIVATDLHPTSKVPLVQDQGFALLPGGLFNRLKEIFLMLRSANIPWTRILSLLFNILQILSSGASWEEIVAAVLALFGLPNPGSLSQT